MLPINTILCPTDFSSPSFEGVKAANELASHFSARLVVLHVTEPLSHLSLGDTPVSFDIPRYEKEMEEAARKQLGDVIAKRVAGDVKVTMRLAVGDPVEEIEAAADDVEADLIVIATHGRTGWRHLVLGSVTEKLVRVAQRPVLTVRRHGEGA